MRGDPRRRRSPNHPSLNDTTGQADGSCRSRDAAMPGEEYPLSQPALPISQIAQLLDVPEDALRTLMAERRTAGDTTLVALTVTEAARRIGIGRTKLYEYVSSGEIASVKIGSLRRIPAEAVSEFLARRFRASDFDAAA